MALFGFILCLEVSATGLNLFGTVQKRGEYHYFYVQLGSYGPRLNVVVKILSRKVFRVGGEKFNA